MFTRPIRTAVSALAATGLAAGVAFALVQGGGAAAAAAGPVTRVPVPGLVATATSDSAASSDAAAGSDTTSGSDAAGKPSPRLRLRGKPAIYLQPRTDASGATISPRSSMLNYLNASLDEVHRTFSRMLQASGHQTPYVRYAFPAPGAVVTTACGPSNDTSFFYCPTDDTIVISQKGAYELWNGRYGIYSISGTGDMSVTLFVAHEYGHNIVSELGYHPSGAMNERAADCFAGTFAHDASRRGILESGDVMEAWQALDVMAEHPGQSDNGLHGTPDDRHRAFNTGWYYGMSGCTSTYLGS